MLSCVFGMVGEFLRKVIARADCNNGGEFNILTTVYVNVRHWLFWYGVYGFCNKSANDEITIYADKEKSKRLGYFDLMTEPCLTYTLKHDLDRVDDAEFCEEIEAFLHGEQDVVYSYIYPRNEEELLRQVGHSAPVNDKGHRPVYIMMFSKLAAAWDTYEIERVVKIIGEEFLHIKVEKIEFLDMRTYEETKVSYERDYAPYVG